MVASPFAETMGVVGTILLCLFEVYPIVHVKRAIDLQRSREIPYKISIMAVGYHICWILYYDTIQPDLTLLMLNITTLLAALLVFMAFLFVHFDTRNATIFCVLFAGFATGWYMIGREFRSVYYFKWLICPFHTLAYLNLIHDVVFF